MTSTAVKSKTKLTDYEQAQVEKIASWKASHPNAFGELFHRAARPVASFFEFIVPDAVALGAIEEVYKASDLAATQEDIKLQAGGCGSVGVTSEADAGVRRALPQVWLHGAGRCDARRRAHGGWWSLDHLARRAFAIHRVPHHDHQDRALLRNRLRGSPNQPGASPRSSRQGIATATRSIGPLTKRGSWGP